MGWDEDRLLNPDRPTKIHTDLESDLSDHSEKLLDRATQTVVREQVKIGIDIPTDGEIRREHYIYYHLRVGFESHAARANLRTRSMTEAA